MKSIDANTRDILLTFKGETSQQLADLARRMEGLEKGTFSRIDSLERTKADRVEIDKIQKILDENIETRVRSLENSRNTGSGQWSGVDIAWKVIIAILTLAVGLIGWHILQ